MSKEPPVGRIGYVLDGFGDGKTADGTAEVYCLNKKGCGWFLAALPACPDCGWERPGFNKEIRTKQLNRNLYEQAARAR